MGASAKDIDNYKLRLSIDPNDYESLVRLCQSYLDSREYDKAIPYLVKVYELDPEHPHNSYNLGLTYQNQGNFLEAITWFENTIKLYPRHIEAYTQLGELYYRCGDIQKSINSYDTAININPDLVETSFAFNGRAVLYLSENKPIESIDYFNKAIKLNPKNYTAVVNLTKAYIIIKNYTMAIDTLEKLPNEGFHLHHKLLETSKILKLQNKYAEATDILEKAILNSSYSPLFNLSLAELYIINNDMAAAKQQFIAAFNHPGINLAGKKKIVENMFIIKEYADCNVMIQQLLSDNPADPQLYWYLGNSCLDQRNLIGAITNFEIATSLDPNNYQYHYALGLTYNLNAQPQKSAHSLLLSLELSPDDPDILGGFSGMHKYANNSKLHQEICYNSIRDLIKSYHDGKQLSYTKGQVRAISQYSYTCLRSFDWDSFDIVQPILKSIINDQLDKTDSNNISPFIAQFTLDSKEYLTKITTKIANAVTASKHNQFKHNTDPNKTKLNIGYISPDFNAHVVGFLLDKLFSYHDRERFNIYGYYLKDINDELTDVIRASCDKFVTLYGLPSNLAAEIIYQDGVDILIDLAGFTTGAVPEILGYQPAPIQAHMIGQAGSMNASFMQYHIITEMLAPPELLHYYSEKIIYLPETPVAIKQHNIPNQLPTKQQYNLPNDKFIFCCFNAPYRINKEVFECWIEILQSVENSILWLRYDDEEFKPLLADKFISAGIAESRIVFCKHKIINDDWFIKLADLYLDTMVVSGGTTGVLSAWVDLPVVSLAGDTPQSRYGAAISKAAGLTETIAYSKQEYTKIAIELAKNPDKLAALNNKLANNKHSSTLFNQQVFAAQLEKAYKLMWDDYHNKVINKTAKI